MKGDLPILIVEHDEREQALFSLAMASNKIRNPIRFAATNDEIFSYLGSIFYHPRLAQNRLPGVIILNHTLSKAESFGVLESIKGNSIYKQIPVVVLSSSSNAEDMDTCYSKGCNGYFTRPFNEEEYKKVVKVIYDFWLDAATVPYYTVNT